MNSSDKLVEMAKPMETTLVSEVGMEEPLVPMIAFDAIDLPTANECLRRWGHKMGPLARGKQSAWCHGLIVNGKVVAVTTASYLIAPVVGGGLRHLTRINTLELSRLCAERSGLCRVAIRLWREFVFPHLPFQFAISYQDADLHRGHTYRFDGWQRVGRAKSGPDTRSGRPGRDKWVWLWPPPVHEGNDPMTVSTVLAKHQENP
jgi:antitoxin VapB